MEIENVIKKARRLLRLRDGAATAGEAQAAARALARLLDKHRITVAELEMRGACGREELQTGHDSPLITFKRMARWKRNLIGVLCRHYGVVDWISFSQGDRQMNLAGRPSDVTMVKHMFTWLCAETERLSHNTCKGKGRVFYDSWRDGFIDGIDTQLRDARSSVATHHQSAALVLRDRYQQTLDFLKTVPGIEMAMSYRRHLRHKTAFSAGQQRGKAQHLGAELGSNVVRLFPEAS